MTIRPLTVLSSSSPAFYGRAVAEEPASYAGRTIMLDDMLGPVYYATNGADFIVATTQDSDGRLLRFVTMLQPGQSTRISAPGTMNQPAKAIEFKRDGDRLLVVDHPRPIGAGALASDAIEGREPWEK